MNRFEFTLNYGGAVALTNDDYTDDVLKLEILQNNNLVRARNKILDSLGRTVEAYNATSRTKKSTNYYTRINLPDSTTDANGIATNYTWNDLGQNLSYISGADNSANMYDNDGNLRNITANNQATTMNYDDLGRITTISSPDSGIRYFTYRKDQDTYTDAKGTLHTLYKGVGGLPVNFTHSNNNSQYNHSNYESYEYDTYGRVSKISSNNSQIVYTRNNLGQLVSKSQNPIINGFKQLPVMYAYNNIGQKISDTYPSGMVVLYEYTNGFITGIKINGTSIVSNVNYNSLLQEATSWTLGGRNVTITKDTDGLLTNFSETGIFNQEITTDNEGHILSLNDSISSNNFNILLNDNYALVSGTINNKNLDYNFGDNHNLTKQIDGITNYDFTTQYGNNKLESIKFVENNTVFSYDYDPNGNLKADLKNKYKYDGNNNLEYIENKVLVNGYENNVMIRYFYNGLNQRIGKQILGGQLKFFVYNENNQVIGEYDSNGAVIAEYVYFGLRPVAVKTNGNVNIVHTDYLGTPRVITSSTNGGNVIWQWKNDNPYGNNKAEGIIEFNLRFAGQYYDSESGLHYNINRTYNPETGRYLQSDPIGLAGGFNTYNYVNKNPLDGVDPLGLDTAPMINFQNSAWEEWGNIPENFSKSIYGFFDTTTLYIPAHGSSVSLNKTNSEQLTRQIINGVFNTGRRTDEMYKNQRMTSELTYRNYYMRKLKLNQKVRIVLDACSTGKETTIGAGDSIAQNVARRLRQDMDNRGYKNIELEVIAPTDTVSWKPWKFQFNPLNDETSGQWLLFDGRNKGKIYVY